MSQYIVSLYCALHVLSLELVKLAVPFANHQLLLSPNSVDSAFGLHLKLLLKNVLCLSLHLGLFQQDLQLCLAIFLHD